MDTCITQWLAGIENHETPHPHHRLRKRKAGDSAPSPRKRVARRGDTTMPTSKGRGRGRAHERVPLNDTTCNTIRPPRRSSRHRSVQESARGESSSGPFQNAPDLAHTTSRQSTTTSTRSRSSSPRKLTTLAALPDPIIYVKQDPYSQEPRPPGHVQSMWDRVKDYAHGRGILPWEMKDEVRRADLPGEFEDESCFDNSGKRQALGDTPSLLRVEEIRQDTTRCKNRKTASEEVWNDVSHVPIGQLACRSSVHAAHVRWQNVKTADIAPRTALLPATIVMRPPEAARVDYAIILESSPQLQAALPFLEPLPGADDPSWAPTLMPDVIHCPFASVIETKKSGGDPQKAEYQIGIWSYAMFQRLRLLLEANGEPNEPLPCLPLFIAEGETWEFYIASQGPDKRTVIWNFDEIGKAVYRKGIYQIIAVQQVVCDLAYTEFGKWFEEHCLRKADS